MSVFVYKKHKQTPAAKYTITYILQNRLPIRIVGTMSAPKVIETKKSKRSVEETTKDKRNVEETTAEIMEEMPKVFDAVKNAEKEVAGLKREMDQNSAQDATLTEEANKIRKALETGARGRYEALAAMKPAREQLEEKNQALKQATEEQKKSLDEYDTSNNSQII